jgi:predicted permease
VFGKQNPGRLLEGRKEKERKNFKGLVELQVNRREAWKLSRIPYIEVAYRSIQQSKSGISAQGPDICDSEEVAEEGEEGARGRVRRRSRRGGAAYNSFRSTIRSVKISKIAFAIFVSIGSFFPFLNSVINPSPESLVSSVSLSLAISLAYIVFYCLQILPSFSRGEAYLYLWTLPVSEKDFSLVAVFSFFRTFDYLALSSCSIQVAAVWLLTGSVLGTLLTAVASCVNIIFAISIGLWLSKIFYKNANRGLARSRTAAFERSAFVVAWGFSVMGIAFLFNFVSFVLPYLNSTIAGNIAKPGGVLISILHPFSLSLVISNVVYPSLFTPVTRGARLTDIVPSFLPPLVAYSSAFSYVVAGVELGRRTINLVSKIARYSGIVNVTREGASEVATDVSLKLRSRFPAFILKDLRLSAKNPSIAFLYASPIFEIVTLAVITAQFPVIRTSAMIVSTIVGCFFTIMICSTLLNTEGAGIDYTLSLPVRSSTVVYSKAILSMLTFFPVPFALLAIGLSRPLTSSISLAIPFIESVAVAAACIAEIAFFIGAYSRRSLHAKKIGQSSRGFSIMAGSDISKLLLSLLISFVIIVAPIGAYALVFFETFDHFLSVVTMLVVASLELGLALRL